MSTLVLARRLLDEPTIRVELDRRDGRQQIDLGPAEGACSQPPQDPELGGEEIRRATLDDLIATSWQELLIGTTSSCPVCRGQLAPAWGAGALPVEGRCRSCGSRLQ